MLGAIAGDVIGSVREFLGPCPEEFELLHPRCGPTDDSILTVAVAEVVLDGGDFAEALRRWGRRCPDGGYDLRFLVPVAATVALASVGVEDAIRKTVSMGGDADTLGCIAGAIAEALHGGVPRALADPVRARLPADMLEVTERFVQRYGVPVG